MKTTGAISSSEKSAIGTLSSSSSITKKIVLQPPIELIQEQQRITVVGTGQMAKVIISMLVVNNRRLKQEIDEMQRGLEVQGLGVEEIKKIKFKIEQKNKQIVKISVLGRSEDSSTYRDMKEKGIKMKFKPPTEQESTYRKKFMDLGALGYKIGEDGFFDVHISPDELDVVSADCSRISTQDHIIVTTKAYDITKNSDDLFENLHRLGGARKANKVFVQNGLPFWLKFKHHGKFEHITEDDRIISEKIGDNIAGGTANVACSDHGDYCVVSTPLNKIAIPVGSWSKTENEGLRTFVAICAESGIDPRCSIEGITKEAWSKLQINVIINGLTTIFGCTITDLLEDKDYRAVWKLLAQEVRDLCKKAGYDYELRSDDEIEKRLNRSIGHTPSTYADYQDGSQIEVYAIYGRPINIANKIEEETKCPALVGNIRKLEEVLNDMVKVRDDLIMNGKMDPHEAANQAREVISPKIIEYFSVIKSRTPSPNPDVMKSSKVQIEDGKEEGKS